MRTLRKDESFDLSVATQYYNSIEFVGLIPPYSYLLLSSHCLVPRSLLGSFSPTFPIWLNIPLSKSSAFFKPLSICETLAVGMAIITP